MISVVLRLIVALIVERFSPPKKSLIALRLKPRIYIAPASTVMPDIGYGSEWPDTWDKLTL